MTFNISILERATPGTIGNYFVVYLAFIELAFGVWRIHERLRNFYWTRVDPSLTRLFNEQVS